MALKICIYTDDYGAGGAAEYTHRMALALRRAGYSIVYVQTRYASAPLRERSAAGIEHAFLDYDTIAFIEFATRDRVAPTRIFLDHRPDLVLFSDCLPESLVGAKMAADFLGIPFISVKHFAAPDTAATKRPKLRKSVEEALNLARFVVPVSNENKQQLQTIFDIDPKRLHTVYNGRPGRFFAPKNPENATALRGEWAIPDDGIVVFTAAQYVKRKGFQYQIQAIEALKAEGKLDRLYFVWAGRPDNSFGQAVRDALERGGCMDHVRMIGHRNDMERCLDAADIFLLPSEREGMPLVIIEAMAKGVPVLGTAVSGIPEQLADCGVLLPDPNANAAGTVKVIHETLARWVENPAEMRAMGEKGRQRANAHFREERTVGEMIRLIEQTVFPEDEYVAPGLERIKPDVHFPCLARADQYTRQRPFSRAENPHAVFVDSRDPLVPFLNRDEAHILFNTAKKFAGRRALEVGCGLGWSTVHLGAGGVMLDVVDPALSQPLFQVSVNQAVRNAGLTQTVKLHAGDVSGTVRTLAGGDPAEWALMFFGITPLSVAAVESCEAFAAPDALILLSNLADPRSGDALAWLKERGWSIRLYDTAQLMAAAWRGDVEPLSHSPDRHLGSPRPAHLRGLT